MFNKCFSGKMGVLMALGLWCGSAVVATVVLHVIVIGAMTVYYVTRS